MKICKVMSWEDFRSNCMDDAFLWHDQGWKADELTEDDILNEYPDDYFDEYPEEELTDEYIDFSTDSYFAPENFAAQTLEYIKELEAEENAEE